MYSRIISMKRLFLLYYSAKTKFTMKQFNALEWILLMLSFSVCLVLIISVSGIVFKTSGVPNDGAIAIRSAMIDLLKIIVGGIFGAFAVLKSSNDKNKLP